MSDWLMAYHENEEEMQRAREPKQPPKKRG